MRKSTLITTIAMIVVVVVALSTATYAWFTSASYTSATQQITTTAAGDWFLELGAADASGNITWSDPTEALTLTAQNGLLSPTVEINDGNLKISSSANTGATLVKNSNLSAYKIPFYTCLTKNGKATQQGDATGMSPLMLRITNSKAETMPLWLTVVVACDGSGTGGPNNRRAAASMSFATVVTRGTTAETATVKTVTNGYSIQPNETTPGSGVEYTEASAVAISPTVINGSGESAVYLERPGYDAAGNNTGNIFKQAKATLSTEESAVGITANQYYYVYNFQLEANVAGNEAVSLLLYSWMDGWRAERGATDAKIQVGYHFSKESKTIAPTS